MWVLYMLHDIEFTIPACFQLFLELKVNVTKNFSTIFQSSVTHLPGSRLPDINTSAELFPLTQVQLPEAHPDP